VRVGLEKASTISIPCETPGEQADVGDGYPGFRRDTFLKKKARDDRRGDE